MTTVEARQSQVAFSQEADVRDVRVQDNVVRRRTDAEPKAIMPRVPPNAIDLAFVRETPDLVDLVGNLRTTDITHAVARVSIPSETTRNQASDQH